MNTIQVPVKVSDETLEEILESAFMSANYWLYPNKITHKKGLSYDLLVPEDDTDTTFEKCTLNKRKLLKGLKQYVNKYGIASIEDGEIDSSVLDSFDCELILQYALFGEQVFG